MDKSTHKKMERKFDISYILAKEVMAFKKYPATYRLEARHGEELGNAYQSKESARLFTSHIARQQRKRFIAKFSYVHFFSF